MKKQILAAKLRQGAIRIGFIAVFALTTLTPFAVNAAAGVTYQDTPQPTPPPTLPKPMPAPSTQPQVSWNT